MSFETVERLKQDYTDKWVTVDTSTPELRRFVGLSGQIKTINMNGRALVQFDSPVDIAWYDIDLSYLKVINAPLPKKTAEKHAEPAEKKAAPAPRPAATGGKSPLELAREQAAAKAAKAAKAAGGAAPAAATGDKPLSKLEIARQQAAAAKARATGGAAPAATPPAAEPAPVAVAPTPPPATPAPPAANPAPTMVGEDGKPLSKLEMARRQGAFKPKS